MTEKKSEGKIWGKETIKKTNDSRSSILQNLINKKEEAESTIIRMKNNRKEYQGLVSGDNSVEEFDRAEKEISDQTYYSLLERKSLELERLEMLITRLSKDGDFGFCEECGERISEKRLLAVPEATMCIDCQREAEKMWKRRDSSATSYHRSQRQFDWATDQIDDSDVFTSSLMRQEVSPLSLEELEEIDIENNAIEQQKGPVSSSPVNSAGV